MSCKQFARKPEEMKLYREVKASEETPIGGKTYRLSNNVLYVLEPIEITEGEIYDIIMNTEDDAVSNNIEIPLDEVYRLQAKAILSKLKGDD